MINVIYESMKPQIARSDVYCTSVYQGQWAIFKQTRFGGQSFAVSLNIIINGHICHVYDNSYAAIGSYDINSSDLVDVMTKIINTFINTNTYDGMEILKQNMQHYKQVRWQTHK